MKRSWTCPKCESKRVGYCEALHDGSSPPPPRRSFFGYQEANSGTSMFGKSWKTVSPAGQVAAFICGDCGYFEQYVKNPEALEWDKLQDFRWCNDEDRPPAKK